MPKLTLSGAKTKIRRLENRLAEYDTLLQRVKNERDTKVAALAEERDSAAENAKFWNERWKQADGLVKDANGRADKAEAEAATQRLQAQHDRERLRHVERMRDRERGYIEGLLDGMHPQRPALPWEVSGFSDHDFIERRMR
jgi:chromosome segregation ATPase